MNRIPAGRAKLWSLRNGLIVGFDIISGQTHALIWTSLRPTAAIDLQPFLPASYARSAALDVDTTGAIVGQAIVAATGESDAVA